MIGRLFKVNVEISKRRTWLCHLISATLNIIVDLWLKGNNKDILNLFFKYKKQGLTIFSAYPQWKTERVTYYAVVPIGRITSFARPSVCPSVSVHRNSESGSTHLFQNRRQSVV